MFGLFRKKDRDRRDPLAGPEIDQYQATLQTFFLYLRDGVGDRHLLIPDGTGEELFRAMERQDPDAGVPMRVDHPLGALVFEATAFLVRATAPSSISEEAKISTTMSFLSKFFELGDDVMTRLWPGLIERFGEARERLDQMSGTVEDWGADTDQTVEAMLFADDIANAFLAAQGRGVDAPRFTADQRARLDQILVPVDDQKPAEADVERLSNALVGLRFFLEPLLEGHPIAQSATGDERPDRPANGGHGVTLEVNDRLGVLILQAMRELTNRMAGESIPEAMRQNSPYLGFKQLFDTREDVLESIFGVCRDRSDEAAARIAEKGGKESDEEMARDGLIAAYLWGPSVAAAFVATYDPEKGVAGPPTDEHHALIEELLSREVVEDDALGRAGNGVDRD